jgi:hypothetical protein
MLLRKVFSATASAVGQVEGLSVTQVDLVDAYLRELKLFEFF